MHDIQYKPEGVYTYVLREDRQRAGCVDCKPVHYGNPIKNAEERAFLMLKVQLKSPLLLAPTDFLLYLDLLIQND